MKEKRPAWPPIGVHPLETVKKSYIAWVVRLTDGNISEAAKLLKVQRYTVRRALNGSESRPSAGGES